ncbi:filamentous hemagglutinin family protein [Roseimicrobium gellanilyticum]|uniref:Filamentous hemagglutinin family protein n=1 Tax=Roseimicrobium gellanilyticum TaxID=748857 RepID=A0A366HL12_9BACT|nr:filamentous haemagglutinin family protein [Roseimicrobium gellanilyticum]RBP43623.1 filamentous hemagglutinin family protein [Roseimicrobium gellanilyticum]
MRHPETLNPSGVRRPAGRLALWSIVACVMLAAGAMVHGGDILRGGAAKPNAKRADAGDQATAAAAAQARANAKDALSRTTQALNAAKAMQAAAQAAATARGANNLGPDPNHPGLMLPDVPNGLAVGGLQVEPGGGWSGASLPTQSSSAGKVRVTVKQTASQALLNWRTFNVGRNTHLYFDQSAGGNDVGQWIAFNKVNDPSGSPSQILGAITAPGQVYIINQNGIIFGGGSQVNTHVLVASSLPISGTYDSHGRLISDPTKNTLITRGLLNNPDAQFLFSAMAQAAGTKGPTEAFTPPPLPASGRIGDVTVQAGAQIVAPTTAANVGGRVMLVGANVNNAGTISTPDGQTILAAGLQVGFEAHRSSDPTLRGLDVYIGAVKDPNAALPEYAGTVTNTGYISAPRANVTFAGKTIRHHGAIESSTSVSLNGRIDFDASYDALSNTAYSPIDRPNIPPFLRRSTGVVELGAGSLVSLLPEWLSAETVVGTQLALRSQVNIRGKVVHLGAASSIHAPNALVAISAGVWDFTLNGDVNATSTFVYSGGQIYVDRGAMINVAGSTDISAPLSQHILTVELRGAELAGSPLQRNSIFRQIGQDNPDITVDLRKTGIYNGKTWYGTPLADLSGYLGLIQRTVGELTVAGGSVTLNAGGSVVLQQGAVIDVSGGFINYQGGTVKTTRVMHSGYLMEIADATPDMVYDGIFTGLFSEVHTRWGITRTYQIPWMTGEHYEQPYIHGGDGGSLVMGASAMALDGVMRGATVAGSRQREVLPKGSELTLAFKSQLMQQPDYPFVSPTPPEIVFQENTAQTSVGAFELDASGEPLPLPADRLSRVLISPAIFTSNGFASLTIENPDGDVTVPGSVHVVAPPMGALRISAANITVNGTITAPGGLVSLLAYNISPTVTQALQDAETPSLPQPSVGRGLVTLGPSAVLNTAGLLVDDRLSASAPLSLPMVTDGGTVNITAFSANLSAGSVIDVSGGFAVSSTGARSYGNAGSIVVKTGQDPGLPAVVGGPLLLGSELRGYSGATGGSLSIQAMLIQIGGSALHEENTLLLDPEFFSQGGFAKFSLAGVGDPEEPDTPAVYVAPGTKIEPVALSQVAVLNSPDSQDASFITVLKPEGMRSPVSISLNASVLRNPFATTVLLSRGDIVFGRGASIKTDALGSVSFVGGTVAVFGSIEAPGGSIRVQGAAEFPLPDPNLATQALATVYLAPGSLLSTKGKTVFTPDVFGRATGSVLPGGSIAVSGNIVAAAGAVLDVSGTSGVLDFHPSQLGLNYYLNGPLVLPMIPATSGINSPLFQGLGVPTRVDSDGGTMTFTGGEMLFVDATLRGGAGGPRALGGSLSVSSQRFVLPNTQETTADMNLVVTQRGPTIPVPFAPGESAIGKAVLGAGGLPVPGMGYFAVEDFLGGGFDSLTLGGNVKFSGLIDIHARGFLKVASGGVISADTLVKLSAPYVRLGQPFRPPLQSDQPNPLFEGTDVSGNNPSEYKFSPTWGTGSLQVTADTLDVGTLSLQGIGEARLFARGDIRGNGGLEIAGNLILQAGQIYPTTGAKFTIVAHDYATPAGLQQGSVTILGTGSQNTPLSAGGVLSIYASHIHQGGVLRAPIGTINLGWDGTGSAPISLIGGVAVATTQQLTLAAGSVTSVSAVDGITREELLIPYGFSPDGNVWVDPFGIDITAGGVPSKAVNLSARSLTTESGSLIDISGGGDLFAYRFIPGNGGGTDILGSTGSFAIIPGYAANFAPYAPFNDSAFDDNLTQGESGYVNDTLSVGDRVYLNGSPGLRAGVYTLLPARYALLPGAFLVTPASGGPIGTFTNADGSSFVAGYRFNDLNADRVLSPRFSRFEVAPASTMLQRAEYEGYLASTFLREGALAVGADVPRLPQDGGYLLLQASQAMRLDGNVNARAGHGGRGGLIDISSVLDILINDSGTGGGSGVLTLSASKLSSFGAESLLIGGFRTFGEAGTTVTVRSGNLTLDNPGGALSGPEIILAANKNLTLAPGSSVVQSGSLGSTDSLTVVGALELHGVGENITFARGGTPISFPNGTPGDNRITSTVGGTITAANGTTTTLAANTPTALAPGSTVTLNGAGTISFASGTGGSIPISLGDGALVRVSGDPAAVTKRGAVAASTQPNLMVGAGVRLQGASLTLDSTYATSLHSSATLTGESINLNSGQISVQFNSPGALQPTVGLVLSGHALDSLRSARTLSLLSYSSMDFYGTGGFTTQGSLTLHAAEIRGFNQGAGSVSFGASSILLDNAANVPVTGTAGAASGTLEFNAENIQIGANIMAVNRYASVVLTAGNELLFTGTGGLTAQQNVTVNTPVVSAARSAVQALTAGGALVVQHTGEAAHVTSGLGATLALQGTSALVNADVILPSGLLSVRATTGDLTIGGRLDVGGTAQTFYDMVKYTDAGEITLTADAGAVSILPDAVLNASAHVGGGDAGRISIVSPTKTLSIDGRLLGVGGSGGLSGSLVLDVGGLEGGLLSSITPSLVGFNESRSIRNRLDTAVVVDGITAVRNFVLSVDSGDITVTGTVDSSGVTGGSIALRAFGNVILESGSLLDASAQTFSNAGKGGAVFLEAGSQKNGVIRGGTTAPTGWVDIRSGSTIDLSVAANTPDSASVGWLTGTLHLRAPQIGTAFNNVTDVAVDTIDGSVIGASSILVEGYWLFDLSNAAGATITTTVQNNVRTNGNAFVGVAGSPSAGYDTMFNRIVGSNTGIAPLLVIAPGSEIINRLGDLTLGATNSTSTSDWNLGNTTAGQRFRFGPKEAAGVLTLRASGNLVLLNTISDGFSSSLYTSGLLAYNPNLPLNLQSWSYRFAAGSDVQAVDFHQVRPLANVAANSGSLQLGKNGGANTTTAGTGALTANAIGNPTSSAYKYQAIRTGTGSIDIATARDVQLLNQFAVIFTAGVQVQDPTMGGTFDIPQPNAATATPPSPLGSPQQTTPAPVQYTLSGGSISVVAGNDITHLTRNGLNALIADSSREMPTNWLYRRGAVDPLTGLFTESSYGYNSPVSDIASTTWWVDFTNFFEGVGALGGGDVTLIAGRDVSNVDALLPTNARMPGKTTGGSPIAPNAGSLVELGGGDLIVRAGRNIDGGVYYVEKGTGTLFAGNEVTTNRTRSPSRGIIANLNTPDVLAPETWLPTTLFVGKSTFDVSARGNVLLGPVANAFLMPQGFNNSHWYKTYFSTYAPDSGVEISSLGGTVNLRKAVTMPGSTQTGVSPVLYEWFRKELLLVTSGQDQSASNAQPWLRLAESSVAPFRTVMDLMAPTLKVTAFSGDINTAGQFILSPSSTGSLEFLAAGAINGMRPTGNVTIGGVTTKLWAATTINVSDTDPSGIYSVTQPLAYQNFLEIPTAGGSRITQTNFLDAFNRRFAETGSTTGNAAVLQFKQALHTPGLLHKNDPDPVRLYAGGGDIASLTVFSPKRMQVFADRDITDVALFIQNVDKEDISIVAAGRDIVAYNPSSPARVQAAAPGNLLNLGSGPLSGDLQVSGPGTLAILAGRDLSLGSGAVNADGTGAGITSIGNARNPYLPFEGANLIVGAGLGSTFGLSRGTLDIETFVSEVLEGELGARYFSELGATSNGVAITNVDALDKLSDEERARIVLELFFIALRDAGRDFETAGNYDAGFAAIDALFPEAGSNAGNISTFSRDIRSKSGGGIGIIAPGGGLALGDSILGSPEVPPGVVTESGGSITIFTHESVNVGISRIFTLRGGNITIWSSTGDIAAGSSAKTVQSAPPTRVLIDPQSADITTDLAGLATGGGIGVLATVKNVPPGDVDLIAPVGTVDAGDAGIRATGNLSIAAAAVLNASNIAVGGTSTGTPSAPVVAAPNIGGLTTASSTAGAAASAATQAANTPRQEAAPVDAVPSIMVVEVLGYGGGSGTGDEEDEEEKRRRRALETQESAADQAPAPWANPAR